MSGFIQTYLKTFYNSNINAEEDLTRTHLKLDDFRQPRFPQGPNQFGGFSPAGRYKLKPKLYIVQK